MTTLQLNPEAFSDKNDSYEPGVFALRQAPKDLMDLRLEFVKRMGWVGDEHTDDNDRYDQSSSTIHLFKRSETGGIIAGMRLTEIDSVFNSLSLEMLTGNQRMYDEVLSKANEIDSGAEGGGLWDLTRLVDAPSTDKLTTFTAFLEIFGAGMQVSYTQGDNLTWIFTTTEEVKKALDGVGIKNDVITQGYISAEDEKEGRLSYVCATKTLDAFESLEAGGFAYRHVANGRDIVNQV